MIIFHGSNQIISVPLPGIGKVHNDYGRGFYCTEDMELAKEWACPGERDGFVNAYRLEEAGMSCLNLSGEGYNVLNWLAVLLENRVFELSFPIAMQGKKYILDSFLPAYKDYDLIRGYRADDSYFSFARAFLNNTITLEQLSLAMRLGNLGEQVVLKSAAAFDAVWKENTIYVQASVYHVKRVNRDRQARDEYLNMLAQPHNGVYLSQIVNEKWTNDDPRL